MASEEVVWVGFEHAASNTSSAPLVSSTSCTPFRNEIERARAVCVTVTRGSQEPDSSKGLSRRMLH